MIHPTLYIGLGSAGVKTLLHLHDHVLDAYGGQWPQVLQLLAVVSDSPDEALARRLIHGRCVRVSVGDTQRLVAIAQEGRHMNDPGEHAAAAPIPWALDQWLDGGMVGGQPSYVNGASNRRHIGHLFLWEPNNHQTVTMAISEGAGAASDPAARKQSDLIIHEINGGHGDPPQTYVHTSLDVVVVGGLTGGTCSGMAPYFGYLARNNAAVRAYMNPPAQVGAPPPPQGELSGIFTMPDAVMAGNEVLGTQWTANAHNALREMEYFHYPFPNTGRRRPHRHFLPDGSRIPPHPDYPYDFTYLLTPRDANGQIVNNSDPVERLLEVLGYSLALQTVAAFADDARAKKGDFLTGSTHPINGPAEQAFELDLVEHAPRAFFSRGLRAFVHPRRLLARLAACEKAIDQTGAELVPMPTQDADIMARRLDESLAALFPSLSAYAPAPGKPSSIEQEIDQDCEAVKRKEPVPAAQAARAALGQFPLPHRNVMPFVMRLNGGEFQGNRVNSPWTACVDGNARFDDAGPRHSNDGATARQARAVWRTWIDRVLPESTASQVLVLTKAKALLAARKNAVDLETQRPTNFNPGADQEIDALLKGMAALEKTRDRLEGDLLTRAAGVNAQALQAVSEQLRAHWEKVCEAVGKLAKDRLKALQARGRAALINWALLRIEKELGAATGRSACLTRFAVPLGEFRQDLLGKLLSPPVCVKHEYVHNDAPDQTDEQKIELEVGAMKPHIRDHPRFDTRNADGSLVGDPGIFTLAEGVPMGNAPELQAERSVYLNRAMSNRVEELLSVTPAVNVWALLNDGRWNAVYTAHINGTAVSMQFTQNYQPNHHIVPPMGGNNWKVFGPDGVQNPGTHPRVDCQPGTTFFPAPNGSLSTVICYCEDGGFSTTFMAPSAPLAHAARAAGPAHMTDKRFPPDMKSCWWIPYAKFVLRETRALAEGSGRDLPGFFSDPGRNVYQFPLIPAEQLVVLHDPDYERVMVPPHGRARKDDITARLVRCVTAAFGTQAGFEGEWNRLHDALQAERTQLVLAGGKTDDVDLKIRRSQVFHDYLRMKIWGAPPVYGDPGPDYLFLAVVG